MNTVVSCTPRMHLAPRAELPRLMSKGLYLNGVGSITLLLTFEISGSRRRSAGLKGLTLIVRPHGARLHCLGTLRTSFMCW
jgi:hypothetical protein